VKKAAILLSEVRHLRADVITPLSHTFDKLLLCLLGLIGQCSAVLSDDTELVSVLHVFRRLEQYSWDDGQVLSREAALVHEVHLIDRRVGGDVELLSVDDANIGDSTLVGSVLSGLAVH